MESYYCVYAGNELRIPFDTTDWEESYTDIEAQLRKSALTEFHYGISEGIVYDETTKEIVIPRSVTKILVGYYGLGVLGTDSESEVDYIGETCIEVISSYAKS